jgi:hypothetical protein
VAELLIQHIQNNYMVWEENIEIIPDNQQAEIQEDSQCEENDAEEHHKFVRGKQKQSKTKWYKPRRHHN